MNHHIDENDDTAGHDHAEDDVEESVEKQVGVGVGDAVETEYDRVGCFERVLECQRQRCRDEPNERNESDNCGHG